MAKVTKSAKSERQKLIDDAMKQQRGADKRRGYAIVGVCVVIALAMIGFAAYTPIKDQIDMAKNSDKAITDIGAPASVCKDIETKDATGVSNHVPEGTTVDYDAAPPAYGAHWNVGGGVAPVPFDEKFYDKDDRPPLEALVHNLEHGYTILWYDDTVSDSEISDIKSIAKKFKGDDDNFRLKFIAVPWLDSDENGAKFPDDQHIAFTHWSGDSNASVGAWQYCSEVSGSALDSFMAEYPYTDAPEAGAI